jgi:predicted glycoside hydrolase/deacetylase ChbG (UPF0249 family)
MNDSKWLIVNADDFGQSPGVNAGIAEAYESGIVTSASLMTRWPAAGEAAEYANAHPELAVGLHVDLGEWRRQGQEWVSVYEVAALDDRQQVEKAVAEQLGNFRSLLGRDPTHLDSHQHVHLREPADAILKELSDQLGVPLRHRTPKVRYCGDFYGQSEDGRPCHAAIGVDALIRILQTLSDGVTELCCHPGKQDVLDTMYLAERERELATLTDPRVRETVEKLGVQLWSFHDLSSIQSSGNAR